MDMVNVIRKFRLDWIFYKPKETLSVKPVSLMRFSLKATQLKDLISQNKLIGNQKLKKLKKLWNQWGKTNEINYLSLYINLF